MQTSTLLDITDPITMIPAGGCGLEAAPAYENPEPWPSSNQDPLTASILHDLRNPLTTICVSAEMLLDANLMPAQARRVASNIHRSAGRMRELIAGFSSLVRGYSEPVEICNLRSILKASCEAAGVLERESIEVTLDVPARIAIPSARTRMESVFLNLVLNSIEAMPGGGAIRIAAVEMGDYVTVEVEDTGPGIPAEIRTRLFEPFVTARKKGGLGLGLSLSRQTVRDHGGELWSEPSAGGRFILSLPLHHPRKSRSL